MRPTDLESLKTIFGDTKTHIALAKITQLSLVEDLSALKCLVMMFDTGDTDREIVARMTWEAVGPSSGVFQFPVVGDLVLIAFAEGSVDDAFVIRRLTSLADKIPLNAKDGHLVLKALLGKNAWMTAKKVLLSQGDTLPAEPLVLGNQLVTLLGNVMTKLADLSLKISTHTHTGNLGYPTSPPDQVADFNTAKSGFEALKSAPIDDKAILSDFAFTEKGTA